MQIVFLYFIGLHIILILRFLCYYQSLTDRRKSKKKTKSMYLHIKRFKLLLIPLQVY